MFIPCGPKRAAAYADVRRSPAQFRALAVACVAVVSLSGCMQGTVPLVGPDPADPGSRVAGVAYRSTIAPYTSLRPASPTGWKQQNQDVAPKSGNSE